MKKGRKTQAPEKSERYDISGMLTGRNPEAFMLAQWAFYLTTLNTGGGHYLKIVTNIADVLREAATGGDDTLAKLLKDASDIARTGKHRDIFFDAQRLRLVYFLEHNSGPVSVQSVMDDFAKFKVPIPSDRWIRREVQSLGRKMRPRGRY